MLSFLGWAMIDFGVFNSFGMLTNILIDEKQNRKIEDNTYTVCSI
jgi:hypothetical protein